MIDNPVQYIKGIGPKRAKHLEKLGIYTVEDLLRYYPREYEDRRNVTKIKDIVFGGKVCIKAVVRSCYVKKLSRNIDVLNVELNDVSGKCTGMFYRKVSLWQKYDVFLKQKTDFKPGNDVFIYGYAEYFFGVKQIRIEEYEVIGSENLNVSSNFNRIIPVYPLTEGINQKLLRNVIMSALADKSNKLPEILPCQIEKNEGFYTADESINKIHFPCLPHEAEKARQRFAFEEFLMLETSFAFMRAGSQNKAKPRKYLIKKDLLTPFKEKLGFEFTSAQKKVINEIFNDMLSPKQMSRILIGDVGSGKTVVSVSSMLLALENGYQAAMLAPTEILAEQHFITLKKMVEGLGVSIEVLTGSTKNKEGILKATKEGGVDIVVGTHAVLEDKVLFKNLGLVVIDEQHKFGVVQRGKLLQKSELPDVLLMTATPIPRTLALTLYGDLDVSTIDSLPRGRQPIVTVNASEYEAYEKVKAEVKNGKQAYIVYPLIEESDKVELKAAVKEAEKLSRTVFKEFRIGLLHGQMVSKDKEKIMLDFRNKLFDILITTTVIEVGIDIPNATVIVIEHADRFGLATLHQLRGRVGRGKDKSYCILLGSPRTADAKIRIETMVKKSSGFDISDIDLKLRGPGEFFGVAQHGIPAFRAGNIFTDLKLIEKAREYSKTISAEDPRLESGNNANLKSALLKQYGNRFKLTP